MKKYILLSIGLLIAVCASAVIPNEIKKEPVKIEKMTIVQDFIQAPSAIIFECADTNFNNDIEIRKLDMIDRGSLSIESEAFPPVILNEGKPIKMYKKIQVPPCSAK